MSSIKCPFVFFPPIAHIPYQLNPRSSRSETRSLYNAGQNWVWEEPCWSDSNMNMSLCFEMSNCRPLLLHQSKLKAYDIKNNNLYDCQIFFCKPNSMRWTSPCGLTSWVCGWSAGIVGMCSRWKSPCRTFEVKIDLQLVQYLLNHLAGCPHTVTFTYQLKSLRNTLLADSFLPKFVCTGVLLICWNADMPGFIFMIRSLLR